MTRSRTSRSIRRAPPVRVALRHSGVIRTSVHSAEDGVDIEVTSPRNSAGIFRFTDAQIDNGRPLWLRGPTVTSEAGTYRFNDDGLSISPADDPSTMVVVWLRDGRPVSTGATYLAGSLDEDARLDAVAQLHNAGTGTEAEAVEVAVKPATTYPQTPVLVPSPSSLTTNWTGIDEASRTTVGFFFRAGEVTVNGYHRHLYADGSGGASLAFASGGADSQGRRNLIATVRTVDGGVLSSNINLIANADETRFGPDDQIAALLVAQPGDGLHLHVSINGRPFTTYSKPLTASATLRLALPRIVVGPGRTAPVIYGLRVWKPARDIDLSDALTASSLIDGGGFPKSVERSRAHLGLPAFSYQASAEATNSGETAMRVSGPPVVGYETGDSE